jgi:hypothetical protein
MKLLIALLLWCILFCISPVAAIVALILYPIVWALLLPLRLVGICADSALLFLRGILRLPARILGMKPAR